MIGAGKTERDAAELARHIVTWRKLLGYTAALACVLMELSLSVGGAFHV